MIRANFCASRKRSVSLHQSCRAALGSYNPPKQAQTRVRARVKVRVAGVAKGEVARLPQEEEEADEEEEEEEEADEEEEEEEG